MFFEIADLFRGHTAKFTYSAEIVSQKVNDHCIFCTVLAARKEFLPQRRVLVRVAPAWPRALYRRGRDAPIAKGRSEKALGGT